LIKPDEVPDASLLLRTATKMATGGHGFMKCYAKHTVRQEDTAARNRKCCATRANPGVALKTLQKEFR
jgi:hypothetical protein